MHKVGEGVPDLIIAKSGHMWLAEVKRSHKAPFKDTQKKFYKEWQGPRIRLLITDEDALQFPHEQSAIDNFND